MKDGFHSRKDDICAKIRLEKESARNLTKGAIRMKKILVTTDGSDNSERALNEVKKLGELMDAELTILTVLDPIAMLGYSYPELSERDTSILRNAGEYVLDEALKLMDDFKGEIKTKLKHGSPADEILKEAENGDYDIIVMGSRGVGIFSRGMLGSVSNKVLNHTETNVFIVK